MQPARSSERRAAGVVKQRKRHCRQGRPGATLPVDGNPVKLRRHVQARLLTAKQD